MIIEIDATKITEIISKIIEEIPVIIENALPLVEELIMLITQLPKIVVEAPPETVVTSIIGLSIVCGIIHGARDNRHYAHTRYNGSNQSLRGYRLVSYDAISDWARRQCHKYQEECTVGFRYFKSDQYAYAVYFQEDGEYVVYRRQIGI